jgi:zinc/manganese transport system ATP-binding protein
MSIGLGSVQDRRETADERLAVDAVGAGVRFGDRMLWSEMDLRIRIGTFTAILGPNGAGKSTLLRTLLGLQPLCAGRLRILGDAVARSRHRVGYVPQHTAFDRSLRIRGVDIVRLGFDGNRWGLPVPGARTGRARAAVRDMVDLVGATAYASRAVGGLSGGEQQRLVIAQALVRRPDILLLDEPLDSLDLANQGAVAALVQRVCRVRGVTVLMVAHDVNPILPYLDQVIYLARGRVVVGRPENVITTGTLTALYGARVEVLRTSEGRLVVVGTPEPPAVHHDRHGP